MSYTNEKMLQKIIEFSGLLQEENDLSSPVEESTVVRNEAFPENAVALYILSIGHSRNIYIYIVYSRNIMLRVVFTHVAQPAPLHALLELLHDLVLVKSLSD